MLPEIQRISERRGERYHLLEKITLTDLDRAFVSAASAALTAAEITVSCDACYWTIHAAPVHPSHRREGAMSQPEHSSMIFCLGVLGGTMGTIYAVAAAGPSNSSILSSTDAATLLSGFGGAVIGGGISWLLARQTAREAQEKHERQRRDDEFAVATAASLKLVSITNGLYTLSNNFKRDLAARPGLKPHEAIRPIAGMIKHTGPFLASDFPSLFKAGRGDLANRALQLEPRYRAIMAAIERYNEHHLALQGMWAPYRGTGPERGKAMRITGSEMQLSPIVLKMDVLDEMVTNIIDHVDADFAEAKALCDEWDAVLFEQLGQRFLKPKKEAKV